MDNPFFVFSALGLELFLVYFLFLRMYSWHYLLTPSGFFLTLFLLLISTTGCINYYLNGWAKEYASGGVYLTVILVTPAVLIVTSCVLKRRFRILIRKAQWTYEHTFRTYHPYILIILFCAVLVLVKAFPSSALYALIKSPTDFGDIILVDSARSSFYLSHSGTPILYVILLLNSFLSPIAVLLAYMAWSKRRTLLSLIQFGFMSILLSAVALLLMHKLSVILLFVPTGLFYLTKTLQQRKRALKIAMLLAAALLLVRLAHTMHYGKGVGVRMEEMFTRWISYRVFYAPTRNVLNYIEYANRFSCRGAAVYRSFARLTGNVYVPHGNELYVWYTNHEDDTRSSNAAYPGAAYLGWGLAGVIVHSFFLQLYFTCIEMLYGKLRFNDLVYASLVASSVVMSFLLSCDLVTFMGSWGGMPAFLWVCILTILRGRFLSAIRSSKVGARNLAT